MGGTYDCIALMSYYTLCNAVIRTNTQHPIRSIRVKRDIGGTKREDIHIWE